MAVHGPGETTLADFELEVSSGAHEPTLHARDRFVRCGRCGRTVPVTVVAEHTLRGALGELSEAPCEAHHIPPEEGGEHDLGLTPESVDGTRAVACDTCGRSAPLQDDGSEALAALAEIPCVSRWSYRELLDTVVGPTAATPPLDALGISAWRGMTASGHGEGTVRVLRHGEFQYTLYVSRTDDATAEAATEDGPAHEVTLRTGPSTGHEAVATLALPESDPTEPTTRARVERLVTFLAATDSLSAGEFASVVRRHAREDEAHREAWLDEAYEEARTAFSEQVGGTPEAFVRTFADGDDVREVLRRVVGGDDGFDDVPEPEFAAEQAGERPHFPGLFEHVAQRYGWRPPVAA
jgi:hypothetical protein